MAELPTNLLAEVKNHLDITWTDEDYEKKLTGIIKRGMSRLDKLAGTPQNYEEEGAAKELLFEYCMYARSNMLKDFEGDYLSEINSFVMDKEVAAFEESDTSTL